MSSSSVFYRRPPRWQYREIVRGEGAYLYAKDGTRYLDASGGALVVERARVMGEHLMKRLQGLLDLPSVGEVRGGRGRGRSPAGRPRPSRSSAARSMRPSSPWVTRSAPSRAGESELIE